MRLLILYLGVVLLSGCSESKDPAPVQETSVEAKSIRGRFMRTIEYDNGDVLKTTLTLAEPNYEIKEYLYPYGSKLTHFRIYKGSFSFTDKTYFAEIAYSTCEPTANTLFYHGDQFNIGETEDGLLRVVFEGLAVDFQRVESLQPFIDLTGDGWFQEDTECDQLK